MPKGNDEAMPLCDRVDIIDGIYEFIPHDAPVLDPFAAEGA